MTFTVWIPSHGETEENCDRRFYYFGDPDCLEDILAEWVEKYDYQSANEWTQTLLDEGLEVCVRPEGSEVVQKFKLHAEASVDYYARKLV